MGTSKIWLCSGALAAFMAGSALASDEPGKSSKIQGPPEPSATDEIIETTRETVRSTVEWVASGIDRRFGDRPFTEGGEVTDGEIGLAYLNREGQSQHVNLRFNARVRLPNLSRYQYAFFGADDERKVVTDQPDRRSLRDSIRQRNGVDNSFFAGLGAWFNEAVDVRVGFRGGLRPFVQARTRGEWDLTEKDRIEARETVFYSKRDRAGSTTAVDYQHVMTKDLAFKWLNSATITQRSPHMAWSSTVGLYESFGNSRVLSSELQFFGSQENGINGSDIGMQIRWEQPIRRYVFGEVSVGHFWTRTTAQPKTEGQWAFGLTAYVRF